MGSCGLYYAAQGASMAAWYLALTMALYYGIALCLYLVLHHKPFIVGSPVLPFFFMAPTMGCVVDSLRSFITASIVLYGGRLLWALV